MDFKENLRFVLDSKGLLTKELSAKTGISENTLKSYLRENSADPTLSKALKIANALGVSLDFLATGRELKKNKFEKTLFPKPQKNPKIAEIESLLFKCSAQQLNAILAVEKEFAKKRVEASLQKLSRRSK